MNNRQILALFLLLFDNKNEILEEMITNISSVSVDNQ